MVWQIQMKITLNQRNPLNDESTIYTFHDHKFPPELVLLQQNGKLSILDLLGPR